MVPEAISPLLIRPGTASNGTHSMRMDLVMGTVPAFCPVIEVDAVFAAAATLSISGNSNVAPDLLFWVELRVPGFTT